MNLLNKIKLLSIVIATLSSAHCIAQNTTNITSLADDLKALIDLNSHTENYIDLSGKESISLSSNAGAAQVIEITAPYLHSPVLNAREICLHLLGEALFKKEVTAAQKKEIINIICKNYLDKDGIHTASNILLNFEHADFTAEAQANISKLSDSLQYFERDMCAQLLALVQVKKSIPALWKVADINVATMGQADLAVLASLARMDDNKAAELLCDRYNYVKNNTDMQVYIAKFLAFSLHATVLKCLIKDYKTIDMDKHYRDVDVYINPGLTLGTAIVSMLKNYPYEKREFRMEPKQLLSWLNTVKQYELTEK